MAEWSNVFGGQLIGRILLKFAIWRGDPLQSSMMGSRSGKNSIGDLFGQREGELI